MKRRSFLKSFVALPFVPGFLKGWVPADIREEVEEEAARTRPLDPLLAAAVGSPLSITVVTLPGQRIKLTGIMHVVSEHSLASSPCVMLAEGDTKLAATQQMWMDGRMDLHVGVILEPPPGAHTYKLTASEGVVHAPMLSMIKAELWP